MNRAGRERRSQERRGPINRARTILPTPKEPDPGVGRELLILVLLIGILALGVATVADPATPGGDSPRAGGALYSERAAFCPGLPTGSAGVSDIAAGSRRGNEMGVLVEPLDASARTVRPEEIALRRVDAAFAHNVVGYGDLLGASAATDFSQPVAGVAAATCSARASSEWYFPQGSSADGYNERLVVYNPFPGDAVVNVTLFTPQGTRTRAALTDIAVPSQRSTTIALNRFVLQHPVLGARVVAERGRVVAWKFMFVRPPAPSEGVSFTVGAADTATTWYFAAGRSTDGIQERIGLINPTEDEAVVTVSLITEGEAIQPPDLVEMTLPRMSAMDLNLRRHLAGAASGGIGVVVTSVNEIPIVAERSLIFDGTGRGFASYLGTPDPAPGWWLGPAALDPQSDEVSILNVSEREASVTLRLAAPDGASRWSEEVVIAAAARVDVELPPRAATGAIVVQADAPVVAERLARTRRDASLMGGSVAPGP